ncbi:MAG: hypothetical protein BKP49_00965 [Treponema sp. CETP13]|nr:MAG: hypothetical protein BKP49_00965 [Treponema sp. CETP13]
MTDITLFTSALKEESVRSNLDGWFFSNFSHHDALTDSLLKLDNTISTRRWVYIIFTNKKPLKILHSIEPNVLNSLPGDAKYYYAIEKLEEYLKELNGLNFAVLSDCYNAEISTMDGGFLKLLHDSGIKTTTAAPLIQRCKGILSTKGIQSHERAATLLYTIVQRTWDLVCKAYKKKEPLYEKTLESFIMQCFEEYNLVTDHPPIVAFGKNTGNPHYEISQTRGLRATEGDLIQFDIWAKETVATGIDGTISPENSIYADISWVGVFSSAPSEKQKNDFYNLTKARDLVYKKLLESSNNNTLKQQTGFSLDKIVRESLINDGYENNIRHRTGHGIDTDCHGSGVNLDSVEFPDKRTLLEGSCFSVEPGIYSSNEGMRTEIDIYIQDGQPIISGKRFRSFNSLPVPQKDLLTIK